MSRQRPPGLPWAGRAGPAAGHLSAFGTMCILPCSCRECASKGGPSAERPCGKRAEENGCGSCPALLAQLLPLQIHPQLQQKPKTSHFRQKNTQFPLQCYSRRKAHLKQRISFPGTQFPAPLQPFLPYLLQLDFWSSPLNLFLPVCERSFTFLVEEI